MSDQTETKPDSGLWHYRPDLKGGKYLVLRRDGTVFPLPNFVLGHRDKAAPAALRAYADDCERLMNVGDSNYNQEYIADVRRLAVEFADLAADSPRGDPGKGPHRKDHPAVVDQMANPDEQLLAAPLKGNYPKIYVKHITGYNHSEERYEALSQKMERAGFVRLRSESDSKGKHWETWMLELPRGPLQGLDGDDIIRWIKREIGPGNIEIVTTSFGLSLE